MLGMFAELATTSLSVMSSLALKSSQFNIKLINFIDR